MSTQGIIAVGSLFVIAIVQIARGVYWMFRTRRRISSAAAQRIRDKYRAHKDATERL